MVVELVSMLLQAYSPIPYSLLPIPYSPIPLQPLTLNTTPTQSKLHMRSQWACFLENLGIWYGSFTRYSPLGELGEDKPTIVSLIGQQSNTKVHQTVEYLNNPSRNVTLDYQNLNRSILFFEDGAFSQGTTQYAPFSQFGGEFGFRCGDRRLRLVVMYDINSAIDYLVLIREALQHATSSERPHLSVDQLVGTWIGEAVSLSIDYLKPETVRTQLTIETTDSGIQQSLIYGDRTLRSAAKLDGSRLLFDDGPQQFQLLMLPDGASLNCPRQIQLGAPFVIEVGWLLAPDRRQRLMRTYDAKGGWTGATLVTEQRV